MVDQEPMQPKRLLTASVTGLLLGGLLNDAFAQGKPAKPTIRPSNPQETPSSRKQPSDSPNELIEKMKASRESLEKLLAVYDKQLQSQTTGFELRKSLYEKDLISKLELEESERAVASTRFHIQQVRQWIAEDDIALAEALFRQELRRLPALPLGGYSETAALIRYNGRAVWSLSNAEKIEKFFAARFGYDLPVSAIGQTPAHERMRFDHREAMDVAVRPDSPEGRELMNYLRNAGIPFIAFRGQMPGSSTGAHIHIGRPSIRFLSTPGRASSDR
ncbi:MAG TPA: hypothetical protein VGR30_16700 [Candidatus Binatia bacterium]|nr:hypothetical protein [Candidatus Binatia bacterium]